MENCSLSTFLEIQLRIWRSVVGQNHPRSRVLAQPVFDPIEEFRFLGEFFNYIDSEFPGSELEWFHTWLGQ